MIPWLHRLVPRSAPIRRPVQWLPKEGEAVRLPDGRVARVLKVEGNLLLIRCSDHEMPEVVLAHRCTPC